uniref:Uncharacterized protein n=1 Tax=Scytonema sp. PCC 10023 TaxID=1680591 RepID=A0A0K0PD85_9CYAN|nr:hypothetical protein [Scytonema sp. PCC 10023]
MGESVALYRVIHGKKKIKLAASIINKLEEIPLEAVYVLTSRRNSSGS